MLEQPLASTGVLTKGELMSANRRQFLSLLALGIPAGVSATKRADPSLNSILRSRKGPHTAPAKLLIVEESENERTGLAESPPRPN